MISNEGGKSMGLNGWLIVNIALGVLLAEILKRFVDERWRDGVRPSMARPADTAAQGGPSPAVEPAPKDRDQWAAGINWKEEENQDWEFLWNNVPQSAKDEVQHILEDDELRRRAQSAELWPTLWYAAPETAKAQLRGRWKEVLKIPPRWGTPSEFEQRKQL
jgi:hypothetical protein